MRVTLGNMLTLRTTVRQNGQLIDDPGMTLAVTKPDGDVDSFVPSQINHDSLGVYSFDYLPDQEGGYRWRWTGDTDAQGASEGTFEVDSLVEGQVTDIRDLRVLIPACRRAIDGPAASAPDSPSTTLSDNEVLGLLADATSELILYTSQSFGFQLLVAKRDPFYLAPVEWMTDPARSPAADAAILSQAALDHYFQLIKTLKVSQSLKNEAQDWSYSISANVVTAWVNYLMANRDKAIEAMQTVNLPPDAYFSTVAERDRFAAAFLEPWVEEIGAPVPYAGFGGSGPLGYDYRFDSWG